MNSLGRSLVVTIAPMVRHVLESGFGDVWRKVARETGCKEIEARLMPSFRMACSSTQADQRPSSMTIGSAAR